MNMNSYYWQEVEIETIHMNFSTGQEEDGIAVIELNEQIRFHGPIKPVAFKDPNLLVHNDMLLHLSHAPNCNCDPKKPLNEIPVKIDHQSVDSYATDIFNERQFYTRNNHSCHGQNTIHGEPLFAYDGITDKYHLIGLSNGVGRRGVKFIDSYKSVWHYLPWIHETVNKAVARREGVH